MPRPYSYEEIEEIVNNKGYFLLEEYKKKKLRRVVIIDEWEYIYDVVLSDLIRGHLPNFVDKSNPEFSLENISAWLMREQKPFKLCENNEYKGIREKLWFHCLVLDCGMNFDMDWDSIYSHGQSCPYCSGNRVSDRNRLSLLYPNISNEWDYKLNNDTPDDFSYSSSVSKFWICSRGHESYRAQITSRTNMRSGCPVCANEQKESKIATNLKRWCEETFVYVDTEHKMFKNPDTNQWLRCDIYIGEEESVNGIYIEVHGGQHFRLNGFHRLQAKKKGTTPEEEFETQKYRDKIKKRYAKKHGTYIEIDLRKFNTTESAIEHIQQTLN